MEYICFILTTLEFIYSSLYLFTMLQQHSYNENNSYLTFICEDIKKDYYPYALKLLIGLVLLLFTKMNTFLYIFYLIVVITLLIYDYNNFKLHNKKKPLKFTKRMIRIVSIDYLFLLIISMIFIKENYIIYLGLSNILNALNAYVIIFVLWLLKPIEKMIFESYKQKADNKISKMAGLNVIGITGSFGKTSTKMILESILKTTYKGFYTPASFNTPNGIIMTINNEPSIFNDYFICEMGAKRCHEIKELCDIAHPKMGIITSIGKAHLESFKSLDNICNTKFELLESLPSDGVCILNKDDHYMNSYERKNDVKVIWIGIENEADVMAKDITYDENGMTFTVTFSDKFKSIKISTVLLGIKNVYNILQAIALSKYMGVKDNNIVKGVKNIEAINHRLELKKIGDLVILDDAFNSNPEGAKNALDVLSKMKSAKVIITPGMVEMGQEEENLNRAFGSQIASVCDKVYLVGKNHSKPIYDGLLDESYDEAKIEVFDSFEKAYNKAKDDYKNEKVTILIENDLPDSYTEKGM